ncbi:Sec-independent protein translocase subunit TatA/TatB [Desulfoferrobacter suflitae]|uniref:Sec-independent protein translocase subunit TatA/TatB n=1 Tax=Desulfoferrobacter suflitae TaxID=2865782 RepID=UPI0021648F72|nr:twin-arginine translocase TatA/TatE family subunit [Desulfoferrobacter suflitae]MCK8604316.1 twin-arginine translocase TatA/TatE family subunit [Desulfoferrobacter suflitae]
MFGLGIWELLIILVLFIFFYGGKKLPQIGEGLGRMISEFRKSSKDDPETLPTRGKNAPQHEKRP